LRLTAGKIILKLLLVAVLLGVNGSVVLADPIVNLLCSSVTNAAQFQNQGNVGCQFGNAIFYGFTYSYTREDSNGNLLPSNVPDTAVTVQFSNSGNLSWQPVVSFLSNWDVINGEQGDIRISYNVQVPVSAAMYFSSMTLSGSVSNVDPANQFNSYISGAETVCCPGPGNSVVPLGVELDPPLTASGLVSRTGTDGQFYLPSTQLSFSKDIFLNAGSASGVPGPPPNGNEATLTRIDQALIEQHTPEPLSFLLTGSGFISVLLLRKRGAQWKPKT
jgi:hypothetical protein